MIVANRNLTSCLFSVRAKYLMHSNSWIDILLHQQWLCVGKQLKQKDQHRQNCKCLVIILRPSVSLFPSNNVNQKITEWHKGRGVFSLLRLWYIWHNSACFEKNEIENFRQLNWIENSRFYLSWNCWFRQGLLCICLNKQELKGKYLRRKCLKMFILKGVHHNPPPF